MMSGVMTLGLLAAPVWPTTGVAVKDIRLSHTPVTTRVVFDLSGPVEYGLFTLDDLERVVVDIDHAQYAQTTGGIDLSHSVIENIRHVT